MGKTHKLHAAISFREGRDSSEAAALFCSKCTQLALEVEECMDHGSVPAAALSVLKALLDTGLLEQTVAVLRGDRQLAAFEAWAQSEDRLALANDLPVLLAPPPLLVRTLTVGVWGGRDGY